MFVSDMHAVDVVVHDVQHRLVRVGGNLHVGVVCVQCLLLLNLQCVGVNAVQMGNVVAKALVSRIISAVGQHPQLAVGIHHHTLGLPAAQGKAVAYLVCPGVNGKNPVAVAPAVGKHTVAVLYHVLRAAVSVGRGLSGVYAAQGLEGGGVEHRDVRCIQVADIGFLPIDDVDKARVDHVAGLRCGELAFHTEGLRINAPYDAAVLHGNVQCAVVQRHGLPGVAQLAVVGAAEDAILHRFCIGAVIGEGAVSAVVVALVQYEYALAGVLEVLFRVLNVRAVASAQKG